MMYFSQIIVTCYDGSVVLGIFIERSWYSILDREEKSVKKAIYAYVSFTGHKVCMNLAPGVCFTCIEWLVPHKQSIYVFPLVNMF